MKFFARRVLFPALVFCLCSPPVSCEEDAGDYFFKDATTRAWQERSRREKKWLSFGAVEIVRDEEPAALAARGGRFAALGEPKKALKSYRRALALSPSYPLAADILWEAAGCCTSLCRWQEAFDFYHRLAKEFPGHPRAEEALDRQLEVASTLGLGRGRAVMREATDRTREEIALEMLEKLRALAPKTPVAGAAQFEAGKILQKARRPRRASEAYYDLVKNDPGHPLAAEALLASGRCAAQLVRKADYNEELIAAAAGRLARFAEENPEDPRAAGAAAQAEALEEVKAQKLYRTAQYYEKTGEAAAARIYFEDLLERYPESGWAAQARKKMDNRGG